MYGPFEQASDDARRQFPRALQQRSEEIDQALKSLLRKYSELTTEVEEHARREGRDQQVRPEIQRFEQELEASLRRLGRKVDEELSGIGQQFGQMLNRIQPQR